MSCLYALTPCILERATRVATKYFFVRLGYCHPCKHGKVYGQVCNCKQAIHESLLRDIPSLGRLHVQTYTMLCSQVGLGVAAAVACCVKELQQDDGTSGTACLPSTKDVLAIINDLKQAEHCITGIQYNPFSPRYA